MSPKISIGLLAAQSDQRLVALVHEGHERAFEALVHRYRRPLLLYCRRRMRLSDAGAEDVLQHALLQAWLALAGGTEVREVRPWLYSIVHNAAVNAMRGRPASHAELADAMHAGTAGSASELDRRIAVGEALAEVAALPRMQGQAIFLTAVDGQSHEEVANTLGITDGALRGLLYRARATLRSAAAAVTPQPLIEWASGGSGASVPTAELSGAGGAFGATGLLLKGAVVAVTAGALATSAAVVQHHRHASAGRVGGAPATAVARVTGAEESTHGPPLAAAPAPRTQIVTTSPGARARVGSPPGHRRATPKLVSTGASPAGAPPAGRFAPNAPDGSSPRSGAGQDGPRGLAPGGPHGDARGSPSTGPEPADAGGGGSSSGRGGHDARDSAPNDARGAGPSPNGPGDGSGAAGSGSDESGGEQPESSAGGPVAGIPAEDRSGGSSH